MMLLRYNVSFLPTGHDLREQLMALQSLDDETKRQRLAAWEDVAAIQQVLSRDKLSCHEAPKVLPVYLITVHSLVRDSVYHCCDSCLVTWYLTCLQWPSSKRLVETS